MFYQIVGRAVVAFLVCAFVVNVLDRSSECNCNCPHCSK